MTLSVDINASDRSLRRTVRFIVLGLILWGVAVAALADHGVFLAMPMPLIAALVASGIGAPLIVYAAAPPVRAAIDSIGLYPLTLFHVWRVPAALAFFAYGIAGQLPTVFWVLAGVGDLIAGVYAARLLSGPRDLSFYRRFHAFGFADFVVAVGAGLTFTLLGDPRMATIAVLPMALIPLFGVGISGASHIIAFGMIRRLSR